MTVIAYDENGNPYTPAITLDEIKEALATITPSEYPDRVIIKGRTLGPSTYLEMGGKAFGIISATLPRVIGQPIPKGRRFSAVGTPGHIDYVAAKCLSMPRILDPVDPYYKLKSYKRVMAWRASK